MKLRNANLEVYEKINSSEEALKMCAHIFFQEM